MSKDAVSTVNLLGREYPLKLSVNAMDEIKTRFGDLDRAVGGLAKTEDIFVRFKFAVSLVTILANHGARAFCYEHPEAPAFPALTEEIVSTILDVKDIGAIMPKVISALNDGMGREVFSMPEDNEKNSPGA